MNPSINLPVFHMDL